VDGPLRIKWVKKKPEPILARNANEEFDVFAERLANRNPCTICDQRRAEDAETGLGPAAEARAYAKRRLARKKASATRRHAPFE